MYACVLETGRGFFAGVCVAGHRPLFSCDPPPPQVKDPSPPPDLTVRLEAFHHHLPLSIVLPEVSEDLFLIRNILSYPLSRHLSTKPSCSVGQRSSGSRTCTLFKVGHRAPLSTLIRARPSIQRLPITPITPVTLATRSPSTTSPVGVGTVVHIPHFAPRTLLPVVIVVSEVIGYFSLLMNSMALHLQSAEGCGAPLLSSDQP